VSIRMIGTRRMVGSPAMQLLAGCCVVTISRLGDGRGALAHVLERNLLPKMRTRRAAFPCKGKLFSGGSGN
jgi:hypothetical protein